MKAYRKRAKGSWQQGKGYKGDGPERQFSKREIDQQLAEAEEDYLERYHKGARNRNTEARLKYRVHWHEQMLEQRKGYGDSFMSYLRSGLESAKRELRRHMQEKFATTCKYCLSKVPLGTRCGCS